MIRIGVNPIAWSNDDDRALGAEISLQTCLREAAEIGFEGVEKGHKFPSDPAALKAALAPHGLDFVSGWWSLNLLERSVEAELGAMGPHLDLLKAMGARVCIVCETSNAIHGADGVPLSRRPVLAEAEWPRFTGALETLAAELRAEGIALVYHHHMGSIIETEAEIDRLMAETGPATRLLLDTGHAGFAGARPAALAARHMGRIGHLHFKNLRAPVMAEARARDWSFLQAVRAGVFTTPGDPEGCVDFPPILEAAAKGGYRGWLVVEAEQDPARAEPRRYQAMGFEALTSMARAAGL